MALSAQSVQVSSTGDGDDLPCGMMDVGGFQQLVLALEIPAAKKAVLALKAVLCGPGSFVPGQDLIKDCCLVRGIIVPHCNDLSSGLALKYRMGD
jgi:hypothetical protein